MKTDDLEEIKVLVEATFGIINGRKVQKKILGSDMEMYFLSIFVSSIVDKVLRDTGKKPKAEQFDYIKEKFKYTKFSIQEAIAIAFQVTMQNYSSIPIEYYCQIKTVEAPKSLRSN